MYSLIGELKSNIQNFSEKLTLTRQRKEDIRYTVKDARYTYSQSDLLALIDMYMSSQFEEGKLDEDGKQKRFINLVRFVRDVSRMRTDVDVRHFIFAPEGFEDVWGSYFEQKQFRLWAKDNYFGEPLNRSQDDYTTYGTAVFKKIGKKIERVPIKNLINTQTADSLKKAALGGGYVIEVHKMTLPEMEQMKNWDTEGFEYGKDYTIYERYSLVPQYIVKQYESGTLKTGPLTKEDKKRVLAMQVLCTEFNDLKSGEGKVLFMQEIPENKFPYEDVFWEKVDGRWLGVGPVEAQLENQRARNMNVNLRRRALQWSAKRVWQTDSDELGQNLLSVKDGSILALGKASSGINPVAMETRNLAEFGADDEVWKENSQQLSFTFEAATGESMPSGTPFRLGVVLSNAVEGYFNLKKEQYGLFLKRVFFNLIVPIFESEIGDHTVRIGQSEIGASILRELMIQKKAGDIKMKTLLEGKIPDIGMIDEKVRADIESSEYMFFPVIANWYKEVKNHIDLDITGEATDEAQKETLINVYTILAQQGDPRAERMLEFILAKTGINLPSIIGKKPEMAQQQMPAGTPTDAMQPQGGTQGMDKVLAQAQQGLPM